MFCNHPFRQRNKKTKGTVAEEVGDDRAGGRV